MKKLCYILTISLSVWGCTQPKPADQEGAIVVGPSTVTQDTLRPSMEANAEAMATTTAQDSPIVSKPLTKWQQDSIRKWKNGYAEDIGGKGVSTRTDFLVKPVPGQPYDTALYNRQAPLREQQKRLESSQKAGK